MDKKALKSAIDLLKETVDNPDVLLKDRMEAAKALLPYTAKKIPDRVETVNRNYSYNVSDERLKGLSIGELEQLGSLLRKLADFGDSGSGDTPEKV